LWHHTNFLHPKNSPSNVPAILGTMSIEKNTWEDVMVRKMETDCFFFLVGGAPAALKSHQLMKL
jgi:hypothetical protein